MTALYAAAGEDAAGEDAAATASCGTSVRDMFQLARSARKHHPSLANQTDEFRELIETVCETARKVTLAAGDALIEEKLKPLILSAEQSSTAKRFEEARRFMNLALTELKSLQEVDAAVRPLVMYRNGVLHGWTETIDRRAEKIEQEHGLATGDLMQVFIRGSRSCTMGVGMATTVDTVREMIHDREGIPVGMQRLIYGGKQMRVGLTLGDYNVHAHSTIFLSLRAPTPKLCRMFTNTGKCDLGDTCPFLHDGDIDACDARPENNL
jgi:hypothetical protein